MPAKIILAGEGGQGIQTIGKILAKTAKKSGKNVSYLPSFGVEQRGGVTLAFIQISNSPITYPRFRHASIIVVLCTRAIEAVKPYLDDGALFIYDSSEIESKHLKKIKGQINDFIAIPAKKIAQEKYTTRVSNMIILGALSNQLKDLNYSEFQNAISSELASKIQKDPKIKDLNYGALQVGVDFAQNYDPSKASLEGAQEQEITRHFKNDKTIWNRFPEYCKGCGLCLIECPVHALNFCKDLNFLGTPMPIVDMQKCIGCGECQDICPDGAIMVEKN